MSGDKKIGPGAEGGRSESPLPGGGAVTVPPFGSGCPETAQAASACPFRCSSFQAGRIFSKTARMTTGSASRPRA